MLYLELSCSVVKVDSRFMAELILIKQSVEQVALVTDRVCVVLEQTFHKANLFSGVV